MDDSHHDQITRARHRRNAALAMVMSTVLLAPSTGRTAEPIVRRSGPGALRGAQQPIVDVAKTPHDLLHGRVIGTCGEVIRLRLEPLAGQGRWWSVLADRHGRFTVDHVPGGLYCAAIEGRDPPRWCFYRVWDAAAAPPSAVAEMQVAPAGWSVVRGKSPAAFPAMTLPQAALYSAIIAGAIATPIIYHNAKRANRVPSSP